MSVFSVTEALDVVACTVFRGLFQQLIKLLTCSEWLSRSTQNLFSTQLHFLENPRTSTFLGGVSLKSALDSKEILQEWMKGMYFFLHVSAFPVTDILTNLPQLASINLI